VDNAIQKHGNRRHPNIGGDTTYCKEITRTYISRYEALSWPKPSQPIKDPEGSLTCSQQTANGPYSNPDTSSLHNHIF